MYVKQIIVSTHEGGEVADCRWVVATTPNEDRFLREVRALVDAGHDLTTAYWAAIDARVGTLVERFGWSPIWAGEYVMNRIDQRLIDWAFEGVVNEADTVEVEA